MSLCELTSKEIESISGGTTYGSWRRSGSTYPPIIMEIMGVVPLLVMGVVLQLIMVGRLMVLLVTLRQ